MEAKGMYAFQKSHGVCYTWLAYQMAYLKINYPTFTGYFHKISSYNELFSDLCHQLAEVFVYFAV